MGVRFIFPQMVGLFLFSIAGLMLFFSPVHQHAIDAVPNECSQP